MTDPGLQAEPPAADDQGPRPANDDGTQNDDCALVVAIGKYRELTPLRGPEPDAIRFATWLREKGGLKNANIRIVDAKNEMGRPVNADIRDALISLGIRTNKRRGRRLYFYYAGHGLGPTFNDVAIVPADAARDMLVSACYGLNQFIDFFVKTGFFDELVVFLDCCREREEVPTIGLPFKVERPPDGAQDVNHFVLMAAGDGAKSFEVRILTDEEERGFRGLMTTALLDGLNGAPGAIDPTSNNVTSKSLSHYVFTRVQEEARDKGLPQVIDKPKPPKNEIIFFKIPDGQVPTIELRLIVGPQTAGQQVMVQNLDTNLTVTHPAQPEGSVLALTLAGNALHQLMIPGQQPVVIDPAEFPPKRPDVEPPDVPLP